MKLLYTKKVGIGFAERNCASCLKFFDGYPIARNLRILCHEKMCLKLLFSNVIREMDRNSGLKDLTVPQV
jgi:hypothetical protein